MAKVDWNAGSYATGGNFEALPAGRYLSLIKDSEKKPTKQKTGSYFEFEFDVIQPEAHKGRKLWARLNVVNASAEAQRIGREQFNALCEAAGLDKSQVTDSVQLHNKLVVLIVGVEPGLKREKVNKVDGFLKPGSDAAALGARYREEAEKRKQEPQRREPATPDPVREAQRATQALDDDIPF